MKLDEQVVVVTGGSRGLGKAVVKAFAREGAGVVINYFESEGKAKDLQNILGEKAVALNMVSGGLLKTTDASAATSEEVFQLIQATTPLQRVTEPEDVADAVLFFASPWARAVTGQNLVVDGGLVMD
ncbi:SDR family oxidoreductase [Heyndrickxia coagulans]|uniref:SDR family oxidoreductase n=1 Tax=Heyndrickxia coagulans TaxID=1398 RepID=UPI00030DAE80|nr:SDR family oxidoreductase [Heyndrickxia coagulans]